MLIFVYYALQHLTMIVIVSWQVNDNVVIVVMMVITMLYYVPWLQ